MFSFLLDGFGHERDYLGSTCVITHPGGGSEVDSTGRRALNKDHTLSDQRVKATINNLRDKIPVVLLAGKGLHFQTYSLLFCLKRKVTKITIYFPT